MFIRQEDFGVLIGDFGLACLSMPAYKTSQSESLDENKRHVETSPNNLANLHSCGVGTHTYSAPEQLRSNLYDFKVDIYSLGKLITVDIIVFF